ncbi:MAG: hypothetical protein ACPGEF_07290, partial [Endozoicomonas sp.]
RGIIHFLYLFITFIFIGFETLPSNQSAKSCEIIPNGFQVATRWQESEAFMLLDAMSLQIIGDQGE